MTQTMQRDERIAGAMLGLVIGDALGGPVEWMTAEEVAAACPDGLGDYPQVETSPFAPGEVTDDTEMALFVSLSLADAGGLDMPDIVRRLLRWAEENPDQLGPSTSYGIAALRRGVPWYHAGSTRTASSGVLPRTAPLGLAFPPEGLVAATMDCGAATHRHPHATASAVAQNVLLARLVAGEDWESAARLDRPALLDPQDWEVIADAARRGTGPDGAVAVFAEAFACVAGADTAALAIERAILMGGDTDTRGAVAGALAGARWGIAALPRGWREGCWAKDEARDAAQRLAALHQHLSAKEDRAALDQTQNPV